MAQLMALQAVFDAQTLDELRDGTRMPLDQVIPMYMRGIVAGAASIEGMRPAAHTVCATLGDPRVPSSAKLKCIHVTLTAATKQTATIVVPAAWVDGT